MHSKNCINIFSIDFIRMSALLIQEGAVNRETICPLIWKNRSLLSLVNHTPDEIDYLVSLAEDLKKAKRAGTERPLLCGKSIALIFGKNFYPYSFCF
mgnify:CR=1 FL=1